MSAARRALTPIETASRLIEQAREILQASRDTTADHAAREALRDAIVSLAGADVHVTAARRSGAA